MPTGTPYLICSTSYGNVKALTSFVNKSYRRKCEGDLNQFVICDNSYAQGPLKHFVATPVQLFVTPKLIRKHSYRNAKGPLAKL